MAVVQFLKGSSEAILPRRSNDTDSGYDVFSLLDCVVPAKGSAIISTGLNVGNITEGYWMSIGSRSGLSFKHDIIAHPGVIDNGYRGEIKIKLFNLSDEDYYVGVNERVAQIIIHQLAFVDMSWIEEATETERGSGGFGSSGTH